LTIKKFAEFGQNLENEKSMDEFAKNFRTPGHVHLLISRGIEKRAGHTELSTEILKIAGITPVACICEILDNETFKSQNQRKRLLNMQINIIFLLLKEKKLKI